MNFLVKSFFRIGLSFNFGILTPRLKIIASYIRYYSTLLINFKMSPPKKIIFICGLPKSGTTWLESLLSIDGEFKNLMPYDIIKWEQNHGRSDNYIPKYDFLKSVPNGKWIVKIHASPSKELLRIIKVNKLKPIIIHRDIEEVLDSHAHYVENTIFHPDYAKTRNLKKSQKLLFYKKKYFDDYKLWIRNWKQSKIMTYNLTYNNLLNNTEKEITNIFKFLNITITNKEINKLISLNSLSKMKNRSVQKEFFRGKKIKN